jgi:WD40 repeat protein
VSREPVPPSQLQPGTPRDLATVCLKCLYKEAPRRYVSALELADDLRRFLDGRPIRARAAGAGERTWRWACRNPGVASLVGVVAGLLLVLAVGASLMAWSLRRALDKSDAAALDAREKLFTARLAQARAGRFSKRLGQRFTSLDALQEAVAVAGELGLSGEHFDELRNEAIACLALPDLRLEREWEGFPPGSVRVDFDGSFRLYARSDRHGNVTVRRVQGDEQVVRLRGLGRPAYPLLSRDGRFVAVGHDYNRLQVWRLSGPEPVPVVQDENVPRVAFSPDSRHVAYAVRDGTIRVWDLTTLRPCQGLKIGRDIWDLAFHPDRPLLAIAGQGAQVRDLQTGEVLADLPHPDLVQTLGWHPGGKRLATGCDDRKIYVWDLATKKPALVLEGLRTGGVVSAFNHAGDRLAGVDWSQTLHLWDAHTGKLLLSAPAQDWVQPLRFSADDRLLAAGIEGTRLRLWRVAAGREYRSLAHAAGSQRSDWGCAVSPDGRLLACGTHEELVFWDLHRGGCVASAGGLGRTTSVHFESSGALLTFGQAGVLRWPVKSDPAAGRVQIGPPRQLSRPGSYGLQMGSSKDGEVIACANMQGAVVMHRDRPGRWRPLGPHPDTRSVAVSPDGRWVATGTHGDRGTRVKVWDARAGRLEKDLDVESPSAAVFSPDGRWLMTNGDGTRLWRVGSWRPGPLLDALRQPAAFSPDGRLLAVTQPQGWVRLVEVDTAREVARLEGPHQERSEAICFSPDGTQLVVKTHQTTFHVWDLRLIRRRLGEMGLDWDQPSYPAPARDVKPGRLRPLQVEIDPGAFGAPARPGAAKPTALVRRFDGHRGWVVRAALSADGKRIVSSGRAEALRVWDVATGQQVRHFSEGVIDWAGLALTRDGKRVLCSGPDNTARLWDVETGKQLQRFAGHTDAIWAAGLSPDGTLAVTGATDRTARAWDVASGKELRRFQGVIDYPRCLAWSPGGKHVAIGHFTVQGPNPGPATVRLWEVATGKQVRAFEGHGAAITAVAFSPDGKRLASASFDRTARLWDVATGKLLRQFPAHAGCVEGVAFTTDGKRLVSCGADADPTVRLWDAGSGKLLARYEGHTQGALGVAVTPDGKHVLSWSKDGTLRLWALPP